MRILVLIGLGLPILAVSGAVAYGSIQQISTTLRTGINVEAPVVAPVPAKAGFVRAGLAAWTVPKAETALQADPATQTSTPLTADPTRIPPETAAASPAPRVMSLVARQDSAAPTAEVVVVSEPTIRPMPRQQPVPRMVVTTGKTRQPAGVTPRAADKPAFRMPWQTGIFQ